jgi:hypothetical protein
MPSDSELLQAIDETAAQIDDDTPTVAQVKEHTQYSHNVFYDVFESWNDALRKAGYTVNHNRRGSKGNIEDMLDAIRELTDDGVAPEQSEMTEQGRYSIAPYYRHFDSWTEAVKEAGFEPRKEMGKRIQKTCEVCGDEFEVKPSISDQRFCGPDCHGVYRSEEYSGKNHPRYKKRVSKPCHWCGGEVKREQWYLKHHDYVFCNEDCRNSWSSQNWLGESNPRWSGGANLAIEYYGPEWDDIRIEIIKSQHAKCRVCGSKASDIEYPLQVHHIKPVRDFKDKNGEINWTQAHKEENLCAVCEPCHKKWEGLPILPNAL